MDVVTLAKQVMDILTPLMPFLTGAGAAAGTAVATGAGEDLYKQGKHLYTVVHEHFDSVPDGGKASRALQILGADPDNRDTVEIKLSRMLEADPRFASTIQQLVQSYRQSIHIGTDAQARNVAITNETGQGVQELQGGDRSTFEGITMTMKDPSA
ncbi:MAG: hypothetical protein ABI324_13685 [Ktedonobacteraceae bacterium]